MDYEICIIGAGSGGLTTAAFCAALGAKVLLVEKHKPGGDCLNFGCVPSKALLHASKEKLSFASAMAHVKASIAAIEPHDSFERFEGLGVKTLKGEAKFLDKNTIIVDGLKITARKFVIATGSRPHIPHIEGLKGYLTNETIFDLSEQPENLSIVGAGVIGVEMSQAFARLGTKVSLYGRGRLLPRENEAVATIIRESLKRDGVVIYENYPVNNINQIEKGEILIASGRAPNVTLDLEKAGVYFTDKGISVDKSLKTTNPKIYAIGDCIGEAQFTHVAGYHGSLVSQNILFKRPISHKNSAIPRVIYSDPEIASVGEREGLRELKAMLKDNDRGITDKINEGYVSLFITEKGVIKGAEIVAPKASEMISLYTMMINKGLKVSDLTQTIIPYPTLSEAGKRAAGEYYKSVAKNPILRFISRFLRKF